MEQWYDKEEDVLNVQLSEKKYWKSLELDGMVLDIAKDGSIIAVEIFQASKVFVGELKKVIDAALTA